MLPTGDSLAIVNGGGLSSSAVEREIGNMTKSRKAKMLWTFVCNVQFKMPAAICVRGVISYRRKILNLRIYPTSFTSTPVGSSSKCTDLLGVLKCVSARKIGMRCQVIHNYIRPYPNDISSNFAYEQMTSEQCQLSKQKFLGK